MKEAQFKLLLYTLTATLFCDRLKRHFLEEFMTKHARFELVLNLTPPSEESQETAAKLGQTQSPQSIAQNFWVLVFATFKIKKPGDWQIAVSDDCSQVTLSHSDKALLERFGESFRDCEFRTWHPLRTGKAYLAYLEMVNHKFLSKE